MYVEFGGVSNYVNYIYIYIYIHVLRQYVPCTPAMYSAVAVDVTHRKPFVKNLTKTLPTAGRL
jgi:hypothetical protein